MPTALSSRLPPYHRFWDKAADILTAAWRLRGQRRARLKAAIALALSFDTQRTLTHEQQLAHVQAIELMIRLAENA